VHINSAILNVVNIFFLHLRHLSSIIMLYVFLCRQSFKVDDMLEKVESDSSKTDVGDPL